jgi:hypothetical protein
VVQLFSRRGGDKNHQSVSVNKILLAMKCSAALKNAKRTDPEADMREHDRANQHGSVGN